MSSPPGDVTQLLLAWSHGNRAALEDLIPVVYAELRRIAARYFRHERPGHTLQPTVLVHEAYLKLVDQHHARWQNRAQFFGVAAQLMRRILVDHARTRVAAKRGGGMTPITLVDVAGASPPRGIDVIALDEALTRLTSLYPEQGRLVELRYFGGLTIEETGEAMGTSPGAGPPAFARLRSQRASARRAKAPEARRRHPHALEDRSVERRLSAAGVG